MGNEDATTLSSYPSALLMTQKPGPAITEVPWSLMLPHVPLCMWLCGKDSGIEHPPGRGRAWHSDAVGHIQHLESSMSIQDTFGPDVCWQSWPGGMPGLRQVEEK